MGGKDVPEVRPEVVVDFFRKTLPFSELDDEALDRLARACSVDFHPKATRLMVRDKTRPEYLYVIQKGGVRLFLVDDEVVETLLDYRGEGASLGVLSLVQDSPANLDAETVEDTFFIKVPKKNFIDLIHDRACIAQYYLKNFSESYLSKAFAEMRRRGPAITGDSGLYLFSAEVGSLASRRPVTVEYGLTIHQAAGRMIKSNVGSLLVREPSGEIAGIVTDKDLRRAVALGLDYIAPIETIMSTPVATIDEHEVCFDALLKMMTRQIHHLAVVKDGEVSGVVTAHDIMVMQGKSPMSIFREIMSQDSIPGLYPLSAKVPMVVRTLVEEGAKANNITRMITVLNDMILEKLLSLLAKELGPSPVPFCWMLMGSEGRREQTFATDQDNAIVYLDRPDDILARAADIYLTAFAERAIEHLVKCGFPPCPGDIMASNRKWRQPFTVWRNYFERWISVPEPEEVLNATIFFDLRAGHGQAEFVEELRGHIARHAPTQDVFLRCLAADCLKTKPPLSFFKSFIVEKDGEYKNRLDIKKRGLVQFTDFARVLALKHGIKESSTLGRLRLLDEGNYIPRELYKDASEAFEFLLQLRLIHQLELVEEGKPPDNYIDPSRLSELEKKTLKEAFGIIGRLQSFLKEMFRLNI